MATSVICRPLVRERSAIRPDCVEGGVFHDHDHHGSSEHRRQDRVLEAVGKMLGLDEEVEGAFGSKGVCFTACPQKAAPMTNSTEKIPGGRTPFVAGTRIAERMIISLMVPLAAPSMHLQRIIGQTKTARAQAGMEPSDEAVDVVDRHLQPLP
jgi:hypothetical protein